MNIVTKIRQVQLQICGKRAEGGKSGKCGRKVARDRFYIIRKQGNIPRNIDGDNSRLFETRFSFATQRPACTLQFCEKPTSHKNFWTLDSRNEPKHNRLWRVDWEMVIWWQRLWQRMPNQGHCTKHNLRIGILRWVNTILWWIGKRQWRIFDWASIQNITMDREGKCIQIWFYGNQTKKTEHKSNGKRHRIFFAEKHYNEFYTNCFFQRRYEFYSKMRLNSKIIK